MSILSRVLVGLIMVASIGFFFLAAYNLQARTAWEQAGQSYDEPLARIAKQAETLRNGDENATPPQPGIRALEVQLHDLTADRGKVWRGCSVQNIGGKTLAEVVVEVPDPDPHQVQDKMVLYAFEEGDQGLYIGEFKVTGIADKKVSLQSTMSFQKDWQVLRLNQSRVTWSLYEKMPGDRHGVFAGLNQAQLAALMPGRPPAIRPVPPEALEEYVRDGTPAQPNDPPDRVMNGKYERELHNYEAYFHWAHAQIASLTDQNAAATTDLALAQKLRDDAQKEVEGRQKTIDGTLKPELTQVQYERDTVGDHLAALQKKYAAVQADIEQLRAENQRLAAEWTEWQLKAAQRLNELIEREQAPAGGGGQ